MNLLFLADVPIAAPTSGSEQVLNRQATVLSHGFEGIYAITRRNGTSERIEYFNSGRIKAACYCANPKKIFHFISAHLKYPFQLYDQFYNGLPFSAIVCHQPFTGFSLLFSRKIRHIPFIYIFHSSSYEEYLLSYGDKNSIKKYANALIRKLIERYCLKRSQKIIVLSEYMKKKVIEIHKIPQEKISINPGGVDLDRFQPSENRANLKNELGLPAGRLHLFTVRNLEPRMGLDNLLKAIALLKEKVPDIHLVIGGEGPERDNLESLIRNNGLKDDVYMTGFIPAKQLPKYYGAADFFVLPTRELEGFGLVTIESLACGTPVLGTPIGGTEEILSNFYSKFLFKDNSPEAIAKGIHCAIHNNLKDENRYILLRARCREYAEQNYSWQRHIKQLKLIINEITCNNELAN